MKIIFECEWGTTRSGGAILNHKAPECKQIAWIFGGNCRVSFPGHAKFLYSSIADGKAKIIEHLRDAGVLVEESDVKAELIMDLHRINAMCCGDFTVTNLREAVGSAIAKAEGGQ